MPLRDSPVRFRLSRLGWQFAFIGVFAMLGGAIRAYNLPLVLAGLLIGALLLQWRWARQTVVAVTIQRRLPSEAFAGQPFTVRFLISNRSAWFPAWLLRIDDAIRLPGSSGRRIGGWMGRSTGVSKASCGIGVVPPGRTLTAQYQCEVPHRGRFTFGPATLSTGVPLGLMVAERTLRPQEELFVYPQRVALKRHWRRAINSREGGTSATAGRSGLQEGDFFGLRGWQAGDSRRWIHWRTTARTGELAVRQFEKQRRFDLCILVDAYLPAAEAAGRRGFGAALTLGATPNSPAAIADHESLEFVISVAATLATELVATPTSKIGLALAGRQTAALPSGGTREQTVAMLRYLSELQGSPQPDLAAALKQMIQAEGRPRDLLILSPRPLAATWRETLQLLGPRTAWKWCSLADGSINPLAERSPSPALAVDSSRAVADGTATKSLASP